MSVVVKICGLTEEAGLDAAIEAGASFVGFVFDPPSRRFITPEAAGRLTGRVPPQIKRVGLFVDADDATILNAAQTARLDILQLHGNETPERVADIRAKSGLPVMAVLRVSVSEHLAALAKYEAVADYLLFDARAGEQPTGGTGKSFDWTLLKGLAIRKSWMLAGGLKAENIAEAVRVTGAKILDVSSGVEDETGRKNPMKIREFIEAAQGL